MNVCLLVTILFLRTMCSYVIEADELKKCCDENVSIVSSKVCEDGKPTSVKCDDTETLLTFEDQYKIAEDSEGVYVDTFQSDSIIREPNFCVGSWNLSIYPNKKVVIVCGYKYWTRRPTETTFYDMLSILTVLLNLCSCVAFLLTAFLYYYLPNLQDVHSSCVVHFTLNSGLWHGTVAYRLIFLYQVFEMKPSLCITSVSLWGFIGLASFCWSAILSLDTWNQSKGNRFTDENLMRQRYKMFGYGVPAALVLASNIHFYVGHYTEARLEIICYKHQNVLLLIYMLLPISLMLMANCYFFIDSQRNFVKIYSSQPKSTLRSLRYRLYINVRLFFIMGLPWSLGLLIVFFGFTIYSPWIDVPLIFIYILISLEGVSVFLILVAFRKRILREIATSNMFSCVKIPEKWKTLEDSETVEESENEHRDNSENVDAFVERSFISLAQEAQISSS